MPLNQTLSLALILTANTSQAYSKVSKFSTEAQKSLSKMRDHVNRGLLDIGVGMQILKPIKGMVDAAAQFEDNMVGAAKELGIGLNSKAFDRLKDSALKTSVAIHGSTKETSDLYKTLIAGGAAESELGKLAERSDDISDALDVTRDSAANTFLSMRKGMALTDDQINSTMDDLNAAINNFGGNAENTFTAFNSVGTTALKTLRFSTKEMVAFSNSMGDGAKASTVLNKFALVLGDKGNLRKMFVGAGGGAKGFIKILDQANKSGNAFNFFQKQGFKKQAGDLAKLAANMNNGKGFATQLNFLNQTNTKGSVSKEADKVDNSRSGQIEKFKSQMEVLKITAGNSLLPALNDLFKTLSPLIDKFADWTKKNPKMVSSIVKLVAGFAAMKIATGGLKVAWGSTGGALIKGGQTVKDLGKKFNDNKDAIKNFTKGIGTAFKSVGKAFLSVGKFMMANPWLLIVMAIATAAFLIYKNWDSIKAFFIRLWAAVKKIFSATWNWIENMFLNYTPYGLIIKHWDVISDWFSGLWDSVKNIFSATWDWIKNMFLDYTPTGLIIKHWDSIVDYFKKLWDKVKNVFLTAWNKIKSIIPDWVKDMFGGGGSIKIDDNGGGSNTPLLGGGTPHLQPIPVRAGNNSFAYSPQITINGNADTNTVNRIGATMRREQERAMADYRHEQDRKRL